MAQCGGITNEELNKLELELVERMQWQLMIGPDELYPLLSQLGDPSAALWRKWGTEACQRKRGGLLTSAPDRDADTGRTTPSSPSLTNRMLGRSPSGRSLEERQASPTERCAKEADYVSGSSPRTVLSRTMSFGGFFGSFSALVSLGGTTTT